MATLDSSASPGARPGWRWDVALSFAGAQRGYVEQVAEALRAQGVRCFYDADEQIDLWGKYLAEELPTIYGEQAAAVVVFVSAEYAARDWTRRERQAALARAVRERREYVLPARFDDTPLPGLLPDMSYIDLRTKNPQQFAAMIADKLTTLAILSQPPAQEAVQLRRQILADTTRALGSDHPTTLQRRHDLVLELMNAGAHGEGVKGARALLTDRMRVLGVDDPTTIDTRALLAYCVGRVGAHAEAVQLRRQVLADMTQVLGSDHPTTLLHRQALVLALGEAGSYEEALEEARTLLPDRARVLGADHLTTIDTRALLAWCFLNAGKPQDAIGLRREVIAETSRVLGEDHPTTLHRRDDLVAVLVAVGAYQEAADMADTLLADYTRTLGTDHSATINARIRLASCLTWRNTY
jgi:hypothetical protein